jgi:hypothetical protein
MFKLKQRMILDETLDFVVVKNESFVPEALLLLTCITKMFAICLPRFQQYHFSLCALLYKVFEPKNMKLKYFSTK